VSGPDSVVRVAELTKIFKVPPEREAGLRAALKSLVRRHTRDVHAVDQISFDIGPGEVVGFLGPKGARPISERGGAQGSRSRCALEPPIRLRKPSHEVDGSRLARIDQPTILRLKRSITIAR